ncbi:protein Faf1p [[Candida] jaroonii]|uniref:Protein Faf1p n=1 Tax=[Candida] jaroonii TaxID=467808 RepID=A0ACA9Y6P4_9ASCO|nr:protein Faf1p [[Candida] jaroonii]
MDSDYLKALEIQRKNFEAQFGTLDDMGFEDKTKVEEEEEEFGGFSDDSDSDEMSDEEDHSNDTNSDNDSLNDSDSESDNDNTDTVAAPKVIRLNDTFSQPILSKKEQKQIRSGRILSLEEQAKKERSQTKLTAKQQAANKKEDDENLENDVKLQRLLQESHILSHDLKYSGADVTLQTLDYEEPTGKARKKALTSRIRNLSDTKPLKLESMPMSMRKGMIKSREKKIAKYEEEAKNAGIILSKVKKGELRDLNMGKGSTFQSDRLGNGVKKVNRVRDRGLKIHSIGKSTKNGLIISKKEIERINKKRS